MSKLQRRIFIAIDEWIGAAFCVYLWRAGDPAFAYVFAFWAFCVYVVSYPAHWGWWSWAWNGFASITGAIGDWWRNR